MSYFKSITLAFALLTLTACGAGGGGGGGDTSSSAESNVATGNGKISNGPVPIIDDGVGLYNQQ